MRVCRAKPAPIAFVFAASLVTSGCGGALPFFDAPGASSTPGQPDMGPIVDMDGTCLSPRPPGNALPAVVEPGISECDLVAREGKPDDVLVGAGRGGRETTILYNKPDGKVIYLFEANRLVRIVR
jgi:hypothetical protein